MPHGSSPLKTAPKPPSPSLVAKFWVAEAISTAEKERVAARACSGLDWGFAAGSGAGEVAEIAARGGLGGGVEFGGGFATGSGCGDVEKDAARGGLGGGVGQGSGIGAGAGGGCERKRRRIGHSRSLFLK